MVSNELLRWLIVDIEQRMLEEASGYVVVVHDPEVPDADTIIGPYPKDSALALTVAEEVQASLNDKAWNEGHPFDVNVRYIFPP